MFTFETKEPWGPYCTKYHDCILLMDVMGIQKGTSLCSIVVDFDTEVVALWNGMQEKRADINIKLLPSRHEELSPYN